MEFLVSRPHPWRKHFSHKGRYLTVGQLVGVLPVNQLTPEQASDDLALPLEAILEALQDGAPDLVHLLTAMSNRRLV